MWVFGYGSLIWNPGFEYIDSKVGFIKGYVRRFWQGNDFHRGNPDKPGRVVTLVEDEQGLTWGRAFLLGNSADSSLAYLDNRENQLGGYCTTIVTFHPRGVDDVPIPALLYIATPGNRQYMGPAPLPRVASEIASACGCCGHNAEYLLRLVDFMKEQVPDVWDEHLYQLEHLVRARLKDRNLSIEDVMGFGDKPPSQQPVAEVGVDEQLANGRQRSPSRSPDFASRVPNRKLKCLDL